MTSPFAPDLVRHLKAVSDPTLSPDGSLVAFTYSWVDPESLESCSRLRLLHLTGDKENGDKGSAAAIEFTQGVRDGSPKFSPDGQTLAFLRSDAAGRRQVWLIPVGGGEARQLTHSTGNVIDLAWSPDSTRLAFSADVDPDAAPNSVDGNAADATLPRVSVARRIKYRYDGLGWRGDAHFHLFVVDAADGACRQITDGDWDDLLPAWSPDGRRIAFISHRREDRDIASGSEAYVLDAAAAATGGLAPPRNYGPRACNPWARWLGRPTVNGWPPPALPQPTAWACGKAGSTSWRRAGNPNA